MVDGPDKFLKSFWVVPLSSWKFNGVAAVRCLSLWLCWTRFSYIEGRANHLMICHSPRVCVIKQPSPQKWSSLTLSLIIRMENLSAFLCWYSPWQDGKSKLIIKVGSDCAIEQVMGSKALAFFLVYPFVGLASGPNPKCFLLPTASKPNENGCLSLSPMTHTCLLGLPPTWHCLSAEPTIKDKNCMWSTGWILEYLIGSAYPFPSAYGVNSNLDEPWSKGCHANAMVASAFHFLPCDHAFTVFPLGFSFWATILVSKERKKGERKNSDNDLTFNGPGFCQSLSHSIHLKCPFWWIYFSYSTYLI